jgi:hypothetical protein
VGNEENKEDAESAEPARSGEAAKFSFSVDRRDAELG